MTSSTPRSLGGEASNGKVGGAGRGTCPGVPRVVAHLLSVYLNNITDYKTRIICLVNSRCFEGQMRTKRDRLCDRTIVKASFWLYFNKKYIFDGDLCRGSLCTVHSLVMAVFFKPDLLTKLTTSHNRVLDFKILWGQFSPALYKIQLYSYV